MAKSKFADIGKFLKRLNVTDQLITQGQGNSNCRQRPLGTAQTFNYLISNMFARADYISVHCYEVCLEWGDKELISFSKYTVLYLGMLQVINTSIKEWPKCNSSGLRQAARALSSELPRVRIPALVKNILQFKNVVSIRTNDQDAEILKYFN